jgi:hypothetical protein
MRRWIELKFSECIGDLISWVNDGLNYCPERSKNRRIKSTRHVEPATNDSSSNCLSDSALNAMPSDASDADIALSTYQEPREMDLELKEEKNKQLHILESIFKSPESNTLSTLIDSGSIIKTKTDSSAVVSDKARTK